MGTGRATQAPKPQQYRGDLAGGRDFFLPLSVLKMLPTRDPQSCLSRNHMGLLAQILEPKQNERNTQFFETYTPVDSNHNVMI
jgi:hypothetical protein